MSEPIAVTVVAESQTTGQPGASIPGAQKPPGFAVLMHLENGIQQSFKTLSSVAENTPSDIEFETLILDDATNDGTAENLLAHLDGTVQTIQTPAPVGYAEALARLAQQASAPLLLLLQQGAVLQPGWMIPLLGALSDPGIVAAQALVLDGRGRIASAGVELDADGGQVLRWRGSPAPDAPQRTEAIDAVDGVCVLVRADRFADVGGLDISYPAATVAFADLSRRLTADGTRVAVVPDARVVSDRQLDTSAGGVRFRRLNAGRASRVSTSIGVCITGMHRSGTSLAASWLERCGLPVHDGRVIPAGIGNEKGHFEDVDFVEINERSLARQWPGTRGWQVSADRASWFSAGEAAAAAALIAQRQQRFDKWAWKDPRSTLLLEAWADLLPDMRTLLFWRPCADVVDSILRRAARSTHPVVQGVTPESGTKIWLTYNYRVLEYRRLYPEHCALLAASAVTEQPRESYETITRRLDLELDYVPLGELFDEGMHHAGAELDLGELADEVRNVERQLAELSDLDPGGYGQAQSMSPATLSVAPVARTAVAPSSGSRADAGTQPPAPATTRALSCVIDADPRFHFEALRWYATATQLAGIDPQDLIVHVVGDERSDATAYLERQGVSVRTIERFDQRSPHSNKIAGALALSADAEPDDLYVLTDSDVLVFDDPRLAMSSRIGSDSSSWTSRTRPSRCWTSCSKPPGFRSRSLCRSPGSLAPRRAPATATAVST